MQLKSARGVQQTDVWAAADQLVGEGLRPTIERVRLKMGRGSPNTVSPLLDGWFATLGARLGVGRAEQSAASDLPAAVSQLAGEVWEAARLEARTEANQRSASAQRLLDAERASIEQREHDLAQLQKNLLERQNSMDELLQMARAQVVDLSLRLAQSNQMLDRRETDMAALQLKLTHLEAQRAADQRSTQEQLQHHAQERRKLEEHASLTERRLMTELDRERQEVKRLKSTLEKSEIRLDALVAQLQSDLQAQAQKLVDADQALRSERQTSLAAQTRASELRGLLDEQARTHGVALAQLNQLLIAVSKKTPISDKFGRRVKVKASRPRNST